MWPPHVQISTRYICVWVGDLQGCFSAADFAVVRHIAAAEAQKQHARFLLNAPYLSFLSPSLVLPSAFSTSIVHPSLPSAVATSRLFF